VPRKSSMQAVRFAGQLQALILRSRLAHAAILSGIVLALYGRGLLPGWEVSPSALLYGWPPWRGTASAPPVIDPVFGDAAFVFAPWHAFTRTEILHGRIPFWNPHALAGAPFLGNMQSGVFSPFTIATLLLPPWKGFGISIMLKHLVASLGMYWFLGTIALEPFACLMGAVAYGFGGPMTAWGGWSHSSTAAFLPLVLGGAELLWQTARLRGMALVALATAAAILGGHAETAFRVLIMGSAYAVFRPTGRARWRYYAQFAGALAVGVCVSAIQILPFLEYLRDSSAWHYRTTVRMDSANPIRALIQFIVPRYFGWRIDGTAWDEVLSINPVESAIGVGLIPWLVLACAFPGSHAGAARVARGRGRFFL